MVTALFSLAIFLSSFLLFLIEPIAGRRLLPLLGGSAAVWTTCLVFFQAALLLGYLCAHALVSRLKPPQQARVFLALLGAAIAQVVLVSSRDLGASTSHPVLSVFWLLSAFIGIPFLMLSAASPLLQSWYGAATAATRSSSPYALYAVSNVGSLLALLAYPTLIEPRLTLPRQVMVWIAGFALFTLACIALQWKGLTAPATPAGAGETTPDRTAPPTVTDRTLWVLLAACGSLLLCATTSYLSQNVAAVPLLWIMPLSVYLLSFVVAFNGRWLWPESIGYCLLAVALAAAGYVLYQYSNVELRFATIPIFCGVLFLACLFCHGEIYRLRPSPSRLTSFYVLVSAGGALGAFFVGVVAPAIFSADYELFLGLVLASALAMTISIRQFVVWPFFWGTSTLAMVALLVLQVRAFERDAIARARNFYGTLRVTETRAIGDVTLRTLYNGTIEHGTEYFGTGRRAGPNTYYGTRSGVGLALDYCCGGGPRRVGVIGLGTGTLAAYGRAGDLFRFYEINPLVEGVARSLFTYLKESDASIQMALGDARVSLAAEASQQFDVLAVDAFSGDAIPVHLLTAQAFAIYRRHLKPNGVLAIHVTNQYLDLAPVVRQEAAHAGLHAVLVITPADPSLDLNRSDWVLVSGSEDFMSRPEVAASGERISIPKDLHLWDDDDYSLLPIVRWNRREER